MNNWQAWDPSAPLHATSIENGGTGQAQQGFNNLSPAWLKSLGFNGPATTNTGNNTDGGSQADQTNPALLQWLQNNGYSLQNNFAGDNGYGRLVDGGGNQIGDQTSWKTDPDNAFGLAMLAAGGFAGAAAGGAFAGSGAFGTGADAGAAGAANGSWDVLPSASGGSGGIAGTGVPEFNAYAGQGSQGYAVAGDNAVAPGATPGMSGIGGTGTTNPMNAYLTNGASDASTIGGQGGYAGAVGQGATGAETLTSAVPGASTSYNWGNALKNVMTGTQAANAASGASGASGSSGSSGGLAAGLVGLGGALAGGSGDTSLLNSVNYNNAATAQGQSQRTNQNGPQGSLNYTQSGTDAQGNPTYTQNVSLGAPYQQNLDKALGNQGTALGNLSGYNQGLPGAYSNLPGLYGSAGSQSALAQQQQDAMYDQQKRYLDPQYDLQSKQLQAQLANQGVTYGTDAYNHAMTQFGSQQNQAYGAARDSAINSGNAYANTLFNQNLAAHQQGISDINSQGANYSGQASGALNGVVQNPTFAQTPTTPTPYLGASQLQNGSNTNLYNAQTQNRNNITNGLTGIGQGLASNPAVWGAIGNGLSGLFSSGG